MEEMQVLYGWGYSGDGTREYKFKDLKNGGGMTANEMVICRAGSCSRQLVEKLNNESHQRKKQKCGHGVDDDNDNDVMFLEEVRAGERVPHPDQIIDLVDDDDEGNIATGTTETAEKVSNGNHCSSSSGSSSSSSSSRSSSGGGSNNSGSGSSNHNPNHQFIDRSMSPSCTNFVTRCFEICDTDAMRSTMALVLERLINKVANEGRMRSYCWFSEAIPQIPGMYIYILSLYRISILDLDCNQKSS